MNLTLIITTGSILLALIPAIVWGYLFYTKAPEPRKWIFLTFFGGMVAVFPIMLYKWSWQYFPELNIFYYLNNFQHHLIKIGDIVTIPMSVIFSFMFVGIMEEYLKHLIVKITDNKNLNNIDDAIEYSIIAALGFAFVENILYFFFIWRGQGLENLIIAFVFRSLFSTFAHILFSGIYGYYYGIAHFASPIYKEKIGRKRPLLVKIFHKIMHMKGSTIFQEEKITEGLLFAMGLHAIFNIILELDFTILVIPFLVIGYFYLSYLFDKKEDHKLYENIVNERL